MSQINVNSPTPVDEGSRTTSAGAGMLAVILALVVAVVVIWLLFSGMFTGPSSNSTNVNVNPPAQQRGNPSVNINVPKVEVNPPAQQQPAQPAAPSKP
jgi:hypothetical protein